ncbi:MAG: hypothetical protein Q4G25_11735 [Paracoccus sp. (in: a-proteobacteria)]|nr:hypothetical protein [Paracoccus sp. (in: a-proteobacteria)]
MDLLIAGAAFPFDPHPGRMGVKDGTMMHDALACLAGGLTFLEAREKVPA